MKFSNLKAAVLTMGFSALALATPVAPIGSGNTTALVNGTGQYLTGNNNNNTGNAANPGQLFSVNAFGFEVYDVKDAIHDFGYQLNGNTSTFSTNYIGNTGNAAPGTIINTTGHVTNSVTTNGGLLDMITASGVFTGVGNSVNIGWVRTYQFTAANVLKEVYTLTNNTGSVVSGFQGFGVYDPDKSPGGVLPNTATPNVVSTNTTGTVSGFNYAMASFDGLKAVLASNNSNVNIGFLPGPGGMYGACVNALTGGSTAGCNTGISQGEATDRSYAYAFQIATFGIGATQSFEVYHIFGNNSFNLNSTLASLSGSSSSGGGEGGVPEPGSMFLMGSACVALGVIARRRAKR